MDEGNASNQAILLLTKGQPLAPWLELWLSKSDAHVRRISDHNDLVATAMRASPQAILIDAVGDDLWHGAAMGMCRQLKLDSNLAIIPVIAIVDTHRTPDALCAGADEELRCDMTSGEGTARLCAAMRRSDRDVDVHPSTRLPGTRAIERALTRCVASGEFFAACYADLDHFKEFNDRYGYRSGDRVIRLVAHILHDVVKGWCRDTGFVGHIGGDDFLFTVPMSKMASVCDDIIGVFDELIWLQYSEQDRREGYFLGKDRRGHLHRVPLMTLSIGVVTNQRRRFTHAAEVSELATEMKSYAKTLPGSLWTLDRRQDDTPLSEDAELERSSHAAMPRDGGEGR